MHVYAPIKETGDEPERGERELTYAEALREAQDLCLAKYPNSYLMGLGVPDPKGIFGTTLGLQKRYGKERVFDIPLSENAMTGVAVGSAITGLRPILTHQRLDFALVSIDQIVNQAAKWHYMFNGSMSVPLVIRMIIGRGWGQGPQHSQCLHAWFAHIPGLRVVMPSTAFDAKGMLIAAADENGPVLFLEHRWLHNTTSLVPYDSYKVSLSKSAIIRVGVDITLVGVSYMTLECLNASRKLGELGIKAEVIDLRSIQPLDKRTIISSVEKTRRIAIVDHAEATCGISSEIISCIFENLSGMLKSKPIRICLPAHPAPTSHVLAENYYPTSDDIARSIAELFGINFTAIRDVSVVSFSDQPNLDFIGPF
jgi:pyruvate dehydrogenase E1 component beta subunit